MAMVVDPSATTCTLCINDFVEPKILPCGHHFCKGCILRWIKSEEEQTTRPPCPLCKVPIVNSTRQSLDSLAKQVEAMPINHGIKALVKAHHVLKSPNVCHRCHNGVTAVTYCFHCEAKMCCDCQGIHDLTMKHHPAAMINRLNNLLLAEQYIVKCEKHPDRQADYYCLSHQKVICDLCTRANSGPCSNCKIGHKMGDAFRNRIYEVANNLDENAYSIASQIKLATDSFEQTEREINEVFRKLQKRLASQRRFLLADLQEKKYNSTYALSVQEINQTALAQNATALQKLVFTASEGCLVRMLRGIREQVMGLHFQFLTSTVANGATLSVNRRLMDRIKADIDRIGKIDTLTISTPKPKQVDGISTLIAM